MWWSDIIQTCQTHAFIHKAAVFFSSHAEAGGSFINVWVCIFNYSDSDVSSPSGCWSCCSESFSPLFLFSLSAVFIFPLIFASLGFVRLFVPYVFSGKNMAAAVVYSAPSNSSRHSDHSSQWWESEEKVHCVCVCVRCCQRSLSVAESLVEMTQHANLQIQSLLPPFF